MERQCMETWHHISEITQLKEGLEKNPVTREGHVEINIHIKHEVQVQGSRTHWGVLFA